MKDAIKNTLPLITSRIIKLRVVIVEWNKICIVSVIYYWQTTLTFWRRNNFLILAHPVYKMWIIQEPNMLELWNKLHFEEKKTESIYHV